MTYKCEECGSTRESIDDNGVLVIKGCGCESTPEQGEVKSEDNGYETLPTLS
jgi:Na+-transporting NADH:ubiquinone oxidoreductase subunit NqrF